MSKLTKEELGMVLSYSGELENIESKNEYYREAGHGVSVTKLEIINDNGESETIYHSERDSGSSYENVITKNDSELQKLLEPSLNIKKANDDEEKIMREYSSVSNTMLRKMFEDFSDNPELLDKMGIQIKEINTTPPGAYSHSVSFEKQILNKSGQELVSLTADIDRQFSFGGHKPEHFEKAELLINKYLHITNPDLDKSEFITLKSLVEDKRTKDAFEIEKETISYKTKDALIKLKEQFISLFSSDKQKNKKI